MDESEPRKKILLVEDEPALREFYSKLFTEAGYAVQDVEDGEQAYELIKAIKFDLVLLDIVLPVMSGMDVLHKMQSEQTKTPTSAVVMMTNIDDPKVVAEGVTCGIRGYIVKSDTTPDKILLTVQENIH